MALVVSNQLAAGTPVHVVQQMAAHRSLAVTALYAHASDEARRAAAQRLEIRVGTKTAPVVDRFDTGADTGANNEAANRRELLVGHLGFEPRANGLRSRHRAAEGRGSIESLREADEVSTPSSAIVASGGQSVGNQSTEEERSDPIEQALADALTRAAAAGHWTTVEALTRELTARRQDRLNIVDIRSARARKR